jgi:hypothetical protein
MPAAHHIKLNDEEDCTLYELCFANGTARRIKPRAINSNARKYFYFPSKKSTND